MNIDKDRWRICEDIAIVYPFPVKDIYAVYERLRNHKISQGERVIFGDQLLNVKRALNHAMTYHIAPMEAAEMIFKLPKEESRA